MGGGTNFCVALVGLVEKTKTSFFLSKTLPTKSKKKGLPPPPRVQLSRVYFMTMTVVLPGCSLRRRYAGRPSCAWLPVEAEQVVGRRDRCPAAGNTCPAARRTPAAARRSCRTGYRRSRTSSSGRSPGTCRIGLSKTKKWPRSFGFDFAVPRIPKSVTNRFVLGKYYLTLSKFH